MENMNTQSDIVSYRESDSATPLLVPFNDLSRQSNSLLYAIKEAVNRVIRSGWYLLGAELEAFEEEFAARCQVEDCVGLANGTDALELGLRALGISPGDQVITVANAGLYSTTAIRACGAIPVFAEVDPHTLTLDPLSLAERVTPATRGVILTHLYGRMSHVAEIKAICETHNLPLIEDCAQAHGAAFQGQPAGSWGTLGCYSFYPTKNLGALGDAGAIVTNHAEIAERVRQLRQYGWTRKYEATIAGGRNSRMDELQAAVLRAKLPFLDEFNLKRGLIAQTYRMYLDGCGLRLPPPARAGEMVYHLFVIRSARRDELRTFLERQGIGCQVHYPIPDHLQPACQDLGYWRGTLPVTERACREVLSLPCFPEMTMAEIERVCQVIGEFIHASASDA